jgi:transposase-like protein
MRIDHISFEDEAEEAILVEKNVITKVHYSTVTCKFCGNSGSVVHYGKTPKGTQRYLCQKCHRTFVDNKAPEKMHYSSDVIASAINRFYDAASLNQIKRQIKLDFGVSPSHMTIYRWIAKYSRKAAKVLANIPVGTTDTWVADETVLKLKSNRGQNIWFWDVIDEGSKFLLATHMSETRTTKDAQRLMEKAQQRAKGIPKTIITDKLRAYLDAVEKVWGADTKHVKSSPFVKGKKEDSTRAIERFHGTLKDRTKVMRALADKKSAKIILDGWDIHYNFFRPHQAHKGKTPAQAAGIKSPYSSWKDVVKDKDNDK